MYNGKKILSIVLARAGSKGIRHKNVRDLLGKPLFMWSVLASLESKYVDLTAISSNCSMVRREYEKFVKENDVKGNLAWVERPARYATAKSTNEEAMIHAIKYLDKYKFSSIVTLQPTSPVRNNELLDKCIEQYNEDKCDSLVTGSEFTPFFWRKIQGRWIYDVDYGGCCERKMRQDMTGTDLLYHDNGSIYVTNVDMLLNTECRLGGKVSVYKTEGVQSVQVDTEFDFKLIENMTKAYNLTNLI